jgi:hypothetical protein
MRRGRCHAPALSSLGSETRRDQPALNRGERAGDRVPSQPAGDLRGSVREITAVLTIFGACVVTFMMLMYPFEKRGFAIGCALSSSYGFLAGTWPFGVVEAIWSAVALRRFLAQPA